MRENQIEKTRFPKYWQGVRKNHRGSQKSVKIISFDTETCYAKVFALGFFNGQKKTIFHGLDKNYAKIFFDFLDKLPNDKTPYVLSAHYLIFDLSVLLWEILNPLNQKAGKAPKHSHFSHIKTKCEVEIFWSRPCFAKIKFAGKTIYCIDTFAFFTMSLEKALEAIESPIKKLKKPAFLGKRVIPPAELEPYFDADLRGEYALMSFIWDMHLEYDANICYSLPMLAGKIFRHHFMKENFVKPAGWIIEAGMRAYHGGKNAMTVKTGWYNCYDLDIRSAYPEAMSQLPDFSISKGAWRNVTGLKEALKYDHGIYAVTGYLRPCEWGMFFDENFKKVDGDIKDVWVGSYELKEAILSGHFNPTAIKGYAFVPNLNAKGQETPFQAFVNHFYAKKESADTAGRRVFFKLCLNSLYGKFIARVYDEDEDIYTAGSMFDSSIACLITSFVRARIHRLEHKYNALHTATDGFLTQIKPELSDLGPNIGQLKQENYGPCLILRNKLYLHFNTNNQLIKSGLHGFQGKADDLIKMYRESKNLYSVDHLIKWSEAWHVGIPPGTPIKKPFELNIDLIPNNKVLSI